MRAPLIHLSILTLSLGCDADCDDPGRIDGDYAVFSTTGSGDWDVTGFTTDQEEEQAALLDGIFANGWSKWNLNYIPGKTSFQLRLDDQPYTATYTQDETTCNSFILSFSGTYTTDINSQHDFNWEGEMSYFGTHLGGTFSYTDNWTQTVTEDGIPDNQGTITIVGGEIKASTNTDTGT